MAELFFIVTTIFVAYVVFVVLGGKKDTAETSKSEEAKPKEAEPQVQQSEKAAPPPAAVKAVTVTSAIAAEKPAAKPTRAKPSAAKPASAKPAAAKAAPAKAPAPTTAVDSLKNPKTGEVAKVPASYSFAKRWIKDALVEEGLLDKVYKNSELDDATNAKIHAALQQLKTMDKYQ